MKVMDKKITLAGAMFLVFGIFIWILNYWLGFGWRYGGNFPEIIDAVLSVALPFFGVLFIYLGIFPNPSDTSES
jgi:apolipoprotein N-acyltransferase